MGSFQNLRNGLGKAVPLGLPLGQLFGSFGEKTIVFARWTIR
jgi:hypothetical protein